MGPSTLLFFFTILLPFTLIHAQNHTESALSQPSPSTNVTTTHIRDDHGEHKKKRLCATCNPTSGLNHCDITTSCITTSPGKHHCACRAGYKANAPGSQVALHYRLQFPGQEYRVFVAPGVECDTLCDHPVGDPKHICNEIKVLPHCK